MLLSSKVFFPFFYVLPSNVCRCLSFILLHSESFFLSINTIRITMAQQCRSFILLSIHSHWVSSFIQHNLESSLIFSLLWITSAAKQTESHIPSPSLSICLVWPECLLLIKKSTYPFWNWLIIRSDLTSFLSNWVCLSLMSFFLLSPDLIWTVILLLLLLHRPRDPVIYY